MCFAWERMCFAWERMCFVRGMCFAMERICFAICRCWSECVSLFVGAGANAFRSGNVFRVGANVFHHLSVLERMCFAFFFHVANVLRLGANVFRLGADGFRSGAYACRANVFRSGVNVFCCRENAFVCFRSCSEYVSLGSECVLLGFRLLQLMLFRAWKRMCFATFRCWRICFAWERMCIAACCHCCSECVSLGFSLARMCFVCLHYFLQGMRLCCFSLLGQIPAAHDCVSLLFFGAKERMHFALERICFARFHWWAYFAFTHSYGETVFRSVFPLLEQVCFACSQRYTANVFRYFLVLESECVSLKNQCVSLVSIVTSEYVFRSSSFT